MYCFGIFGNKLDLNPETSFYYKWRLSLENISPASLPTSLILFSRAAADSSLGGAEFESPISKPLKVTVSSDSLESIEYSETSISGCLLKRFAVNV